LPYQVIVGDKERESGSISVRARNGEDLGQMSVEAFLDLVNRETGGILRGR